MSEPTLIEPLASRDFETVQTEVPGRWATNGDWSVQSQRERSRSGRKTYAVRIYDEPIETMVVGQVRQLAVAESAEAERAYEMALTHAEAESNGQRPPCRECEDGTLVVADGVYAECTECAASVLRNVVGL